MNPFENCTHVFGGNYLKFVGDTFRSSNQFLGTNYLKLVCGILFAVTSKILKWSDELVMNCAGSMSTFSLLA